MASVEQLINDVAQAKERFISSVGNLGNDQIGFKTDAESWSILEVAEHIARAEQSGVSGIWKALDGFKCDAPVWSGTPEHRGLKIEEVIERTWQEKEKVPAIAAPQWGGSISYWLAMIKAQQKALEELAQALTGIPLEDVIFPHPISGPLDAGQRLEFLRFHLDRHRGQVEAIKRHPNYPDSLKTN